MGYLQQRGGLGCDCGCGGRCQGKQTLGQDLLDIGMPETGIVSPYYDNTPFCVGYRAGTIQTLVPAPECYDLAAPATGDVTGPNLPPVYTTTTSGTAPRSNLLPWMVAGLAGVLLLSSDGGSRRRR